MDEVQYASSQQDRSASWISYLDQLKGVLDRPFLYIGSLDHFAYLKIDFLVCTLSQLPSPMKEIN